MGFDPGQYRYRCLSYLEADQRITITDKMCIHMDGMVGAYRVVRDGAGELSTFVEVHKTM
jgi:hypothetical protein